MGEVSQGQGCVRFITGFNPERGAENGFLWIIEWIPRKPFAHASWASKKVDDRDGVPVDALCHGYVLASCATSRTADHFYGVKNVFGDHRLDS